MRVRPLILFILALSSSTFAAAPTTIPVTAIPGGFGVNIHFNRPLPGELQQMADAGVRWVRTDLDWAGTEKSRGKYDFSAKQELLRQLATYHIGAYLILDYGNPLYGDGSPHTNEQRRAFAAWAVAAVQQIHGSPIVWEIWNEPNGNFWKPKVNVDDYAQLALETDRAIHAAAPEAICVGPAVSSVDFKFSEGCFKAGCLDDWSAVSVHPYRKSDPETVLADYQHLRELIHQYAPARDVPILSGEWGFSSVWKGFDEQRQAQCVARQWLFNTWQNIPISIWYDWRDDGSDPENSEHHFGMMRRLSTTQPTTDATTLPATQAVQKPAYLAAKTLKGALDRYQFTRRIDEADAADFVLDFAHSGHRALAAWTTGQPHDISVPIDNGPWLRTSMLGETREAITISTGSTTLSLSNSPQYLTPVGPGLGRPRELCDQPIPKYDKDGFIPDEFMNRHLSFLARGKAGPIGVLFIGDSITDWWVHSDDLYHKFFDQYQPANFGIAADRTQHVLWRIANGELDGISPKVIVLMIGTNNVPDYPVDQIYSGDLAIINAIHAKLPRTRLLLLGIFPRGTNPKDAETIRFRPKIDAVNQRLAKLDDGKMTRYLDLGPHFLDPDGSINMTIMRDGLHPTHQGYEVWGESMGPLLQEMMK